MSSLFPLSETNTGTVETKMLPVQPRLVSGSCYFVQLTTTLGLFRGTNVSTCFILEIEIYIFFL